VEIIYQDDGHGLDIARTREVMIKHGLLVAGSLPTREDLQNALFSDGFSTADRVTMVSGRGVGMSAVRGMIQQQGGTIDCDIIGDDFLKNGTAALRWVIRLPLDKSREPLKTAS
jgi:two-component system chemotaxis sensor kinase CheA